MAVFFRKARLEPLAFDHFWLSDTPEVTASNTWGTKHRRMVTWVKFRDRQTQREFFLWNTHFDNDVQAAREKSARLVRERVEALNTTLPVILTGDFNAAAGTNQAYTSLTSDGFFADTWVTARVRTGEGLGTSNGFQAVRPNGARIGLCGLGRDRDVLAGRPVPQRPLSRCCPAAPGRVDRHGREPGRGPGRGQHGRGHGRGQVTTGGQGAMLSALRPMFVPAPLRIAAERGLDACGGPCHP